MRRGMVIIMIIGYLKVKLSGVNQCFVSYYNIKFLNIRNHLGPNSARCDTCISIRREKIKMTFKKWSLKVYHFVKEHF